MPRNVKIELVGGVGNQLFGVALGRYLEVTHDVSCRFVMRKSSHRNNTHGFSLHQTDVFGRKIKIDKISMFDRMRLAIGNFAFRSFLKVHVEDQSSSFLLADSLTDGLIIRGYFQVLWPWKGLIERDLTEVNAYGLKTRDPLRFWLPVEDANKFAFLHVRLGDYDKISGYSIDRYAFYRRALIRLHSIQPEITTLIVFSDEEAKAIELVRRVIREANLDFEVAAAPPVSHPLEDILRMSSFRFGVIANSTFSLWAGLLAGPVKSIIYPLTWFADEGLPRPEVPEDWVGV